MIDLGALSGSIAINGIEESKEGLRSISTESSNVGNALAKTSEMIKKSMLAAGAAIGAACVASVKKADELQQSLNTLQTKTGATSEEMDKFHDSLLNIYSQNYGENFEDIASSMASIEQQTGLTGQALEDTTVNAMALRDTFDWEVDESIRAVDMLMKQFGISSEEAYNLLAQGAQNGLDKNQNLLDSVNQYSVHFKQLGFSSEEMFNMFANGAETGVFDIDKLGDAVKEFGIRSKTIDDCGEALTALGFNAEDMVAKFNAGGEEANTAFQQVAEALINCEDKTKQNTLATELFGTMYEDLGIEAIAALTNVNGEMDKTKETMDSIKEIKYDDLGSAFEGIGRQLEVGLLIPLGEALLPKINEFANWINENMPQILSTTEGVLNTIGDAIGTVADNSNILIPILSGVVAGFAAFKTIGTVTSIVTTLSGAIASAGGVTAALSAAFAAIASPVAIAAAAIGALIAIMVTLYQNNEQVRDGINQCWEVIKECFNSACEFIKGVIDNFVEVFNQLWTKYGDDIKEIAQAAWDYIAQIIKTAVDLIKDIFNVFSKAFQGDWKGCWEAVKKLASDLWNNITDALGKWLDLLVKTVVNIGHAMFEAGKAIFDKLFEGAKNIWESIKSWLETAKQDPVKAITGIGSKMFSAGKEIFNQLLNGLKNVWTSIENWVGEKIDWITSKVKFWEDSNDKMNVSSSSGNRHRTGLDVVPYDGYRAILHKGEAVLTEAQNERYRKQMNQQPTIITNPTDTSNLESLMQKTLNAVSNIPKQMQINNNMA